MFSQCILFDFYFFYEWGRDKHLTLNLNVINNDIASNTMHGWNHVQGAPPM